MAATCKVREEGKRREGKRQTNGSFRMVRNEGKVETGYIAQRGRFKARGRLQRDELLQAVLLSGRELVLVQGRTHDSHLKYIFLSNPSLLALSSQKTGRTAWAGLSPATEKNSRKSQEQRCCGQEKLVSSE